MGIFDALNTSVGGLQAQSFALQNISGNIANASTTGYKGIGTSFEDLIPQSATPDRQVAGGVTAFAQATITTQGTVTSTTVATNMAINGQGFFNVQKPIGITDNSPVFDGTTDYTRRGDFQLNASGNLVNGAGYYLMGVAVDPKTGNPIGNVPTVLQFANNFIPAQATTSIQYAANLPTTPSTAAASGAVTGTLVAAGGLNVTDFTTGHNPVVAGTPAPLYTNSTAVGGAVDNKNYRARARSPQHAAQRRRQHGFDFGEFRAGRHHHRQWQDDYVQQRRAATRLGHGRHPLYRPEQARRDRRKPSDGDRSDHRPPQPPRPSVRPAHLASAPARPRT